MRGRSAAKSHLFLVSCAASIMLAAAYRSPVRAENTSPKCLEQAQVRAQLRSAADPGSPYRERIEGYKNVISACPQAPSPYSGIAELLLTHYQFEEALRWIQQGLTILPGDPALNLDRAGAYLLMGQPNQVISSLQGLPPTAKGEFYLGLAYRNLKDRQNAQNALRQSSNLGYHDPFLLYALAEQDRFLKDNKDFTEDLESLRKEFPSSAWFHMAAADNLKAQQKIEEAKAEYDEVQKINPNLPFLNHQLGSIAFNHGDYSLALSYFRKEIVLNPTYPAPYVYEGICLHRLAKNSEALPFLQAGVARAPEAPLAYKELALVQMDLDQLDPALATLQTACAKFPDMSEFPAQLAKILRRMGRPEEAKVQAAIAQQLGEKHVEKQQQMLGIE